MITTLTCNPALDRTLIVPGFRNTDVSRVRERHDAAGGKGLNVARALQRLGAPCQSVAPLGGHTGHVIATLAQAEHISLHGVPIAGETRTCLLITDVEAPDQLVVNEPGPHISAAEWQALHAQVVTLARSSAFLTISGSLPPGATSAGLRALVDVCARDCQVALDTSGEPLVAHLDAPIALLKINASELGASLGIPIDSPAAAAYAAQHVIARGPHTVAVTLSAAGAVVATSTAAWYVPAPTITAVSPVGSGDCTLAGMVMARSQGADWPTALRHGVACGSANALIPHAAHFDIATYAQFVATSTAHPLT